MAPDELATLLATMPEPTVDHTDDVRAGLDASEAYLASEAALESLRVDTYWPKWDSPWWHMVLLWEMGEARRIAPRAVRAMVEGLTALPLHIFPLTAEEVPAGVDPGVASSCHCALGSMDQVLAACGVDVDAELPWVLPWYTRYQMADGGLNCDETAYHAAGECPSSMVGTLPPFEAMLRRGQSPFVESAAAMILGRELRLGSSTTHNAAERTAATTWPEVTFPRFYFYDVLRGARAIVRWATTLDTEVPLAAIDTAVTQLARAFPDGIVRVQRRAFTANTTRRHEANGAWTRGHPASRFALLEAVSTLGTASATLTREWSQVRRDLLALIEARRVR